MWGRAAACFQLCASAFPSLDWYRATSPLFRMGQPQEETLCSAALRTSRGAKDDWLTSGSGIHVTMTTQGQKLAIVLFLVGSPPQ